MLDVVVESIAIPDAFKRQAGGERDEFKRTCEDPNRSFISAARKEPRAPAASSGSVIMHRGLKACFTIIVDQWS
jgi:hypothetical protein